jgi:ParB family chromosome partitioning protein
MTKKTGLGRGLDALIPSGDFSPEAPGLPTRQGYENLPIKAIKSNPRQPRTQMDQDGLDELAASIRENGILQPLIVSPTEDPEQYVLIAGERRLVAAGNSSGDHPRGI